MVGVGRRKHIGNLLEIARRIRGLSADEIARRCNVTRGRVYQWEKQRFVLPKNLPALSAALGVPLKVLIAANGGRPPKKIQMSKKKHHRGVPIWDYMARSSSSCTAASHTRG